jgi:tRNA/tmRNA/rRNA uracil-C5-methylase (TrmA/RlmC/RlmD family)
MNPILAQDIRKRTVECLGDVAGKVVWDLFGGVGDIAEMLAELGARVWSVDSDRSAVEWGQRAHARNGGSQSTVTRIAERAEEAMARLPDPELVVVNPPRGGLGPSLTDWLRRWGGKGIGARLAYISCDPATLARDLARMPTLQLKACTAFDMFPQTGHVETLTLLEAA